MNEGTAGEAVSNLQVVFCTDISFKNYTPFLIEHSKKARNTTVIILQQ
jgi:hypothetical protein